MGQKHDRSCHGKTVDLVGSGVNAEKGSMLLIENKLPVATVEGEKRIRGGIPPLSRAAAYRHCLGHEHNAAPESGESRT